MDGQGFSCPNRSIGFAIHLGSPSGWEKCLKGAYEHCAYILAGLGGAV
jgi:hypothetical protein